jgi:hypothetical protein
MQSAAVVRQNEVSAYQRNQVGGLVVQLLRQLFVVLDEMGHVDIAKVLLGQDILSYLIAAKVLVWPSSAASAHLIPVDEGIVDSKRQDEVDQLLLDGIVALLAVVDLTLLLTPKIERVDCLAIHLEWMCVWFYVVGVLFAGVFTDSLSAVYLLSRGPASRQNTLMLSGNARTRPTRVPLTDRLHRAGSPTRRACRSGLWGWQLAVGNLSVRGHAVT